MSALAFEGHQVVMSLAYGHAARLRSRLFGPKEGRWEPLWFWSAIDVRREP